jgi:GNAT superfamily N-acetyltransferase
MSGAHADIHADGSGGGNRCRWRILANIVIPARSRLRQLHVIGRRRRQGNSGDDMNALIEEATHLHGPITLAVVEISPALRLYERLGFRVTHEDESKIYMRRECNRAP